MKIVYFGTPEFAVCGLDSLVKSEHEVLGVVTSTDKPTGRKKNINPVKEYAEKNGLTIYQPENLKNPEFIEKLRKLEADIFVVIAFRMLPEVIWRMPKLGTINIHASLLPKYRGAAPIQWSIIRGEKMTGLTSFFLRHEIDTGDIIKQIEVSIGDGDTFGSLHDKLMEVSGEFLLGTLKDIEDGTVKSIPQDSSLASSAPKIYRETGRIDWEKTGREINNLIRGLSPYPGAWTIIDGKVIKIFKASVLPVYYDKTPPGTIETDRGLLHIKTADNILSVLELQEEGKRRMTTAEYLRGNNLKPL